MSWTLALVLSLWSILVTVDLVSMPQGLLARPLVAGTVAGMLAGFLTALVLKRLSAVRLRAEADAENLGLRSGATF